MGSIYYSVNQQWSRKCPRLGWSAIKLSPPTERSMSCPMTVGIQEMSHFCILLNHIKDKLSFLFSIISEKSKLSDFQFSFLLPWAIEGPQELWGREKYRTAPLLKFCGLMAAIAHVLVVCSNMGSCQAAPVVPSMRDLRAFTKAPRITGLSFQSFQLQGAAFFFLRGAF